MKFLLIFFAVGVCLVFGRAILSIFRTKKSINAQVNISKTASVFNLITFDLLLALMISVVFGFLVSRYFPVEDGWLTTENQAESFTAAKSIRATVYAFPAILLLIFVLRVKRNKSQGNS